MKTFFGMLFFAMFAALFGTIALILMQQYSPRLQVTDEGITHFFGLCFVICFVAGFVFLLATDKDEAAEEDEDEETNEAYTYRAGHEIRFYVRPLTEVKNANYAESYPVQAEELKDFIDSLAVQSSLTGETRTFVIQPVKPKRISSSYSEFAIMEPEPDKEPALTAY